MALANPTRVDTADVREVLGIVKASLGNIEQQFRIIDEQSARVHAFGPGLEQAAGQVDALRKEIKKNDDKQQARMQDIKDLLRTKLKSQMETHLQSHIQSEIQKQVALQVKHQVALQIGEHIPLSLEEQARETREQVALVTRAFENSLARRTNSCLRSENLSDPLAVVWKADGTRSEVYPANLTSLFSYGDDDLKRLLGDFGIAPQPRRETNLNRFMAHVGIRFEVYPVPEVLTVNATPGKKGALSVKTTA